jgi:D-lactate dehydrogenase
MWYNKGMKIAFFELFKSEQEILEKSFKDESVSFSGEKLTEENVNSYKDVEIISIFTGSVINKNIIDALPNLKFINTSSTGYDHIDLKSAEDRSIKISNVPSYGSFTVAEFTFSLLLVLSRNIIKANNQLRQNDDFSTAPLEGFDLRSKTLGVIGTGRIGKNVIRIAKGFGMNVIAYDTFINKEAEIELGFSYKSFEEIIKESDVITLHVPYSKENFHLINKENISKMKKGVYILNTARGELIDTEALVYGLKEGIIAGAGLDVLEGERDLKEEIKILSNPESGVLKDYKTLLEDHMLLNMPNVIVTPHIAFNSKEAKEEIIKTTIENIKGFEECKLINIIK